MLNFQQMHKEARASTTACKPTPTRLSIVVKDRCVPALTLTVSEAFLLYSIGLGLPFGNK